MQTPTPSNVRRVVESLTKRDRCSQSQVAARLGISLGGLKKAMMTGDSGRQMAMPTWQLLLLIADQHPTYRLEER